MSKLKMRSGRVAVERIGASKKSKTSGFFVEVEDTQNCGIVKAVSEDIEDLKAGDKIYFGNQLEPIRVHGHELLIMGEDNVFALEEESSPQQ